MLCVKHHDDYDEGQGDKRLQIIPLTRRGANGRLRFMRGNACYDEVTR